MCACMCVRARKKERERESEREREREKKKRRSREREKLNTLPTAFSWRYDCDALLSIDGARDPRERKEE